VCLFVTNLVLGDAGIATRLSIGAVRPLCFASRATQAGTHKLLAGVARHAACLRVAVLHPLLLKVRLGTGGYRQCDYYSNSDRVFSHRLLLHSPIKDGLDSISLGDPIVSRIHRPKSSHSGSDCEAGSKNRKWVDSGMSDGNFGTIESKELSGLVAPL
jgi:hypothetical protein